YLFFSNATSPPDIYTLSLHDALPIYIHFMCHDDRGDVFQIAQFDDEIADCSGRGRIKRNGRFIEQDNLRAADQRTGNAQSLAHADRKSTRLNSSHSQISYAVFCLKKK